MNEPTSPQHQNILSTAKTVLECTALVAAGLWTLFQFGVIEYSFTHSNFNGSVSIALNEWSESKQGCLFDFTAGVENVGKRTQMIDHIKYTVCVIEPPKTLSPNLLFEVIEGKCAKSQQEVKMTPDFILGDTKEVHPGEKKSTVYSFIAQPQEWPWQVEATGYADKEETKVLFRGSDWKFCRKPAPTTDAPKQ